MKAVGTTSHFTTAKRSWLFSECLYVGISVFLPFLAGFLYCLVRGYPVLSVLYDVKKYFLIALLLFLMFTSFSLYLCVFDREKFLEKNTSLLSAVAVLLSFAASPLVADYLHPFASPLVFCGLTVALFINHKFGVFVHSTVCPVFFLCYLILHPSPDYNVLLSATLLQLIGGNAMIISTYRKTTRISFLTRAFFIGILIEVPLVTALTYLLPEKDLSFSLPSLVKHSVSAFASVFISLATFWLCSPLLETALNQCTAFRLEELCSPNAALIERLRKEAPGTYNHSVAMSILAQDCAKAIGEDASLAKAGAYYHDVGKLKNPVGFTENQTGYNPHDYMIPEASVRMIVQHTKDGADMIRQKGLPEAIARIAEEHHGTTQVSFFLNKTRGLTDEQLAKSEYSYSGPKPSTKISGIIMIVDTVEAATRSQGVNKSDAEFRDFIHSLIMAKMNAGQFDECPLTLKDFKTIEETLIGSIKGLYHQRIKYTK